MFAGRGHKRCRAGLRQAPLVALKLNYTDCRRSRKGALLLFCSARGGFWPIAEMPATHLDGRCWGTPVATAMRSPLTGASARRMPAIGFVGVRSSSKFFHAGHEARRRKLTRMYGPAVRRKRFRRSVGCAVLHQCIRPQFGACAPGHHGYQRACVLISGPASSGPFGSPGFACAGKTVLHLVSSSRRPRQVNDCCA
jgi:hypothetical protein